MPCNKSGPGHAHLWVDNGLLIIESCERYCQWCQGADAGHQWKYAWFLRRHVAMVHCKPTGDHPNVTVQNCEKWHKLNNSSTKPGMTDLAMDMSTMTTNTAASAKITQEGLDKIVNAVLSGYVASTDTTNTTVTSTTAVDSFNNESIQAEIEKCTASVCEPGNDTVSYEWFLEYILDASHKRDERTAGCIEYYAHPTVANFERVLSHFSAAGADANISLQVIACVFAKAAVNLIKYAEQGVDVKGFKLGGHVEVRSKL